MKFNSEVVRFDFAGIPMVGNLKSGYAIGLTERAATLCDRLLEEELEAAEIAAVDEELYRHLCLGGFFRESMNTAGVKTAYFHVTQRCNLDCLGCYSHGTDRNLLDDAPLESLLLGLHELAGVGITGLIISGGEPFLRDDLVDIVSYAKLECGIQSIDILSNGTCLNKRTLEGLAPYVNKVSISFDGCSQEAPAYIRGQQRYRELVEAVKMVLSAGINGHIIATIHAKNYKDMIHYDRLAKELGVSLNYSLLSCAAGTVGLDELTPDTSDLLNLAHELHSQGSGGQREVRDAPLGLNLSVKHCCGAAKSTISVGADGTVYPCHMLHIDELAMGNIFQGSIAEVVHGEIAMAFSELSVGEFEGCRACEYQWLCGGGCRARSLTSYGNLVSRDGYCALIAAFNNVLGRQLREKYATKMKA